MWTWNLVRGRVCISYLTREAWREAALSLGVPFVEIEVVCTDGNEHRDRVFSRVADIPGLVSPTWEQVQKRQYDEWDTEHIVIDTVHQTVDESIIALRSQLTVLRRIGVQEN